MNISTISAASSVVTQFSWPPAANNWTYPLFFFSLKLRKIFFAKSRSLS